MAWRPTTEQNFKEYLKKYRESIKQAIKEIYDKWGNDEVMNVFLVRNYYRLRADYYSHQDFPPESNERVKRKRQASLDELAEIDKLITRFAA